MRRSINMVVRFHQPRCILTVLVVALFFLMSLAASAVNTDEEGFVAIPKSAKTSEQKSAFLQHLLDSAFLHKDNRLAAITYAKMGAVKYQDAFYHLSITYFKKAIDYAALTNNKELTTNCYNRIGVSFRQLDDLKNAYLYHKKALDIAASSNNLRFQEYALNGIGNIHLTLNQPDKAIPFFRQSLAIAIKRKNLLGQAINYANIGAGYTQKRSYNLAISYYYKSLHANKRLGNKRGIRICHSDICNIYLKINKLDKAIEFAKSALSESGNTEPIDSANFYLTLAKINQRQHLYQEGEASSLKAASIGKRIHSKTILNEAYTLLSSIYKQSNQQESYLKAYEKALAYKDSINQEYAQKEISDLQQISDIERKDSKIKQLMNENKIKDLEQSKSDHTLIIVILCSTLALMITFLFTRKVTSRAIQTSNDFEIRLLRSQMNPHFIYNSLNSIQKFIWSNNPEEASVYLSNFSMLMRKTMDSMRLNLTSLTKEIELIKLYLDLEKQRLSNEFEYVIEAENDLQTDDVLIPPLLLQPFVENAVWHGIAPLLESSKGFISIRYSANNGFLTAVIEDNGIGINESKKNKEKQSKTHESAGMTITSERLKLIYRTNKIRHFNDIKIADLSDTDATKRGTSVTVQIPYKEIY